MVFFAGASEATAIQRTPLAPFLLLKEADLEAVDDDDDEDDERVMWEGREGERERGRESTRWRVWATAVATMAICLVSRWPSGAVLADGRDFEV